MDIKIGTRTFLEAEVSNGKKRADLYQKMVELAPEEPTQQEHSDGAVTKLRWEFFNFLKFFFIFAFQVHAIPGEVRHFTHFSIEKVTTCFHFFVYNFWRWQPNWDFLVSFDSFWAPLSNDLKNFVES